MLTLEIRHIDTCMPDFFCGDPRPTLAVPLTGDTPIYEVKQMLIEEFNSLVDERLDEVETDHFVAQIDEDFNEWFGGDMQQPFDSRIASAVDEFCPTIYAYFTVTPVTEIYSGGPSEANTENE